MDYLTLKWLHVLSSTVLFGTGLGSAYYLFFTLRSGRAQAAVVVAREVVRADWIFTATTVILQPLSGLILARMAGLPLSTPWLAASIALFALACLCWLPVVWIQIRMLSLARSAVLQRQDLPPALSALLAIWTALGVIAFVALVLVFYLMVAKPAGPLAGLG